MGNRHIVVVNPYLPSGTLEDMRVATKSPATNASTIQGRYHHFDLGDVNVTLRHRYETAKKNFFFFEN